MTLQKRFSVGVALVHWSGVTGELSNPLVDDRSIVLQKLRGKNLPQLNEAHILIERQLCFCEGIRIVELVSESYGSLLKEPA